MCHTAPIFYQFYVQFTIQTLVIDKITSVSTGYRDIPVYCQGEKGAKFELFAELCNRAQSEADV